MSTDKPRCDHCGSHRIINDCPRCGAPVCCSQCCQITTLEELLKRKEAVESSPREAIERAIFDHRTAGAVIEHYTALTDRLLTALTPLLAPAAVNENAVEQARADKVLGTGFYRAAKPGTFGRSEWLDLLMACQDGRATCMRVLEIIERETVPVAAVDGDRIKSLAEAFLHWSLPESVCADLCATKQQIGRVGTNLLSFVEAEQMMRDIVLPHLSPATDAREEVRLDWLDANMGKVIPGTDDAKFWMLGMKEYAPNKATNIRAAIDSASDPAYRPAASSKGKYHDDTERMDWLDKKISDEALYELFGYIPSAGNLRQAVSKTLDAAIDAQSGKGEGT